MKVLCITQKRMNEALPCMKIAAKKLGETIEIYGEEYDNPAYIQLTEYFVMVEKNGPEGQPIPSFINKYSDTEIFISFYEPFSRKVMDILQNAKIIGSIRGGYQHINVEEATKRGIAVFSVPGRNAHSVSDYTIAMILAEARELSRNSSHIMAGDWLDPLFKTHYQPELYEKTIGIVGLGSVGRLVAKKLINGWDMRVLGYDPFISKEDALKMGVRLVDLPTLFRESDFISIHAKATKNNNKMVNGELLSLMKPTAFFINTARASLVDNIALYRILKDRRIAGAALDVMDVEPIPKGDPFLSLENVTITGHLAGNSSDTISNSPYLLVKEIIDFIKNGSKVGLVNPEVLENEKFFTWKLKMKERL